MKIVIPESLKNVGRIFINLAPVFTVVGLILTLIGLIFAVQQVRQAREQEKHISEIVEKSSNQQAAMSEIANAISTRYIGTFPENMDAINALINSTKNSLFIVVDIPAYGNYSSPEAYQGYNNALMGLVRPVGKLSLE